MTGFIGEYESTIDAKGRFLLPTGFRKQLPEQEKLSFVINRGFEKCLTLYPNEVWQPIFTRISQLNVFNPHVREFRRYFLIGATAVDLDTAGRLLLPKNLMEHAGLEKDIVLVSAINKLEIWDKIRYQEYINNYTAAGFSDLANQVMGGNSSLALFG